MRLQVGLTAENTAWQQLLDQERIPYQTLANFTSAPNLEDYPIIVVSRSHLEILPGLNEYLKKGGVVVGDRDSRDLIHRIGILDRCFILEDSVLEACSDWSSGEKLFSLGNIAVSEIAALKKKSLIRRSFVEMLKKAFFKQGLPYVHLWYYPTSYLSVFSFRFDLDEYDPDDHNSLCRLLAEYHEMISCFACMKTYEDLPEQLDRVVATGTELASHGYVHHVYDNYVQNKLNLERAEKLLKRHVESVDGFTGPHGKWNPTLQRVLEENNYRYSSEFSLDYDNLPFFPLREGRLSSVLQIPAHAVCEGVILQRYPYDEGMLKDYYDRVIDDKVLRQEPMVIFGHPTRRIGRHPEILTNIFQCLNRYQGIWKTNLKDYADWWVRRHQHPLQLNHVDGKIRVSDHPENARYDLELFYADGLRKIVRLSEILNDPLNSIPQTVGTNLNSELCEQRVRTSPGRKMKLALKYWLDWEVKTPLVMLKIVDFKSFLKYVLRLFFSGLKM